MEMEHMSHKHTLTLTNYKKTPENAVCYGCHDIIMVNTYVYRCSKTQGTSINYASLDSACASFFLHKTCSELTQIIQHPRHDEHILTLHAYSNSDPWVECEVCGSGTTRISFFYHCEKCIFGFLCFKCIVQERILNHEFHTHSLTLLPFKSILFCGACGIKGMDDFSYLCQTCLFWIHRSCAIAPKFLICQLHNHDHPLLLSDSIPETYNLGGLVCSICWQKFKKGYWLYYCADCRFFAHMKCAANEKEFLYSEFAKEVAYKRDVNQSKLVQFPVCGDKHHSNYKLIEQFANSCSSTSKTADRIRHCTSGHPLVVINTQRRKSIVNLEQLFCSGCLQPLSVPVVSFYGCVECKYFLHGLCYRKLPGTIEHPSHPTHTLVKRQKIGDFIKCNICINKSNGIFYECERSSCSFFIDIMCASLPIKIKHESHKHFLTQEMNNPKDGNCKGCDNSAPLSGGFFSCGICKFSLHVGCVISPGTVKHRWDEHQLHLTYPPVKQHPHDFECEFCSKDINPNFWFYHCRECDMSFHLQCIKQGNLLLKFYLNNLRFPTEECAIL